MNTSALWLWGLPILAALTILLPMAGNRWGLPALLLLGRWTRWALFTLFFAHLLTHFELSDRPYWIHLVTGAALWFLLETGYNWMVIKALSVSDYPLFPLFRENREGDDWPADARIIPVRDALRKADFTRKSALKAHLLEGISLRSSVYEHKDGLIRAQLYFIPKPQGGVHLVYAFHSEADDGTRLITDNLFVPFGGYYPDNWQILRKPLSVSFDGLLRCHNRRMKHGKKTWCTFEDAPLEDINSSQSILEKTNLERGFLVPKAFREEAGKITREGRYRVWKEMWLLAYFGRAMV